ncbi:hypothetical protein PVAND_007469 [Polypedilum vanderplanki]|uniref:Glycoside hydrolase n=1 Tax=Polypedilum vanderplanki TaxID=319348 RepID=A0A9J6C6S5_POLVA|nr:hypothetical protein PVAND_007469 [Polypedilum vanderplanki]
MNILIIFSFLFIPRISAVSRSPILIEKESFDSSFYAFPKNFSFGASTAAYQIEGAWNEDGKGQSIWDTFTHNHPDMIADGTNGDIGDDSYHHYLDDIKALKEVGFEHYRFSVSWARIFPNGTIVNKKGFDYYHKLLDQLIVNNIEPVVTMLHYDIPQWVQDYGGFLNPYFVKYFKLYAQTLYTEFGSKVKIWITFNEPYESCVEGYSAGTSPPLINLRGTGEYICAHNVLLAHAAAYDTYKKLFKNDQRGMVGITLDSRFYFPKNPLEGSDIVNRAMNFELGWFAHPIFSKNGDYPQVMIDEINERSNQEGRPFSRLPEMSNQVKEFIRGSADFLGFNYYSSRYVEFDNSEYDPTSQPTIYQDSRIKTSIDENWKRAKSEWLYSVPQGLHDALVWIKNEYNNIPVIITENGWSDSGELEDDDRINYYKEHLISVAKAINIEKCNVLGYTAWSIIDNFEWRKGFSERFVQDAFLQLNQYNGLDHKNDIAIIEMPSSFNTTEKSYLKFARLPTTELNDALVGSTVG